MIAGGGPGEMEEKVRAAHMVSMIDRQAGSDRLVKGHVAYSIESKFDEIKFRECLRGLVPPMYLDTTCQMWRGADIVVGVVLARDPILVLGRVSMYFSMEDSMWYASDVGQQVDVVVSRVLGYYDSVASGMGFVDASKFDQVGRG